MYKEIKKKNRKRNRITRTLNRMLIGRDVIAEYQKHKDYDVPDIRIFRNHIKDRFHISESTFRRYLSIPIERNIKEFQRQLAEYDSKNNRRK